MQLGKVFVYFVSNTISDYTPNIIEKSKANGNFYVHLHSQKMISWLAFVLLTQAGVIWGEEPQLRNASNRLACGKGCGNVFMVHD